MPERFTKSRTGTIPVGSERDRAIQELEQRFSAGAIRRNRLNRLFQGNAWLVWICKSFLSLTMFSNVWNPPLIFSSPP